jgi:hypothetical protein
VAESLPGYEFDSWIALLAPAATPRPLVDQVNAAVAGLLYGLALLDYKLKGYTLIENGDVEELLVFDPKPADTKELRKVNINKEEDQKELRQIRKKRRLERLENILNYYNNDTYKIYDSINLMFHKPGNYYRLTGNHDADLHKDDFKKILQQQYAGIEVYDYLVLYDPNGKIPKFIITHGHQFDESSSPQHAEYIGEIYSECLSWAYEGADRVWRWNTHTKNWMEQLLPFNNALVSSAGKLNRVHDIGVDAFFRLGKDNRIPCSAIKDLLKENEVASDVVVIGGSAFIDGKVTDSLVVFLGGAKLGPHAEVRKELTVIGGGLEADPGAIIGPSRLVVGAPVPGGVPSTGVMPVCTEIDRIPFSRAAMICAISTGTSMGGWGGCSLKFFMKSRTCSAISCSIPAAR